MRPQAKGPLEPPEEARDGKEPSKSLQSKPCAAHTWISDFHLQTVRDHTAIVSNLPVLQGDLVRAAPGHSRGKQKKMLQFLALGDDEGVTGPEEEGKQDRRGCKAGQSRAVPHSVEALCKEMARARQGWAEGDSWG